MSYSSLPFSDKLGSQHGSRDLEYPHNRQPRKPWRSKNASSEGIALTSRTEPTDIKEFSSSFKPFSPDTSYDAKATAFSRSVDDESLNNPGLAKRTSTNERPKPILHHGLRPAVIKVLPHILAVVVIVAIVQLSFREQYWMDLVPPNQQISPGLTQGGALNALQLAAKLVELVILASLSFIVMYTSQRYLLGRSGLPLGLMASPHQVITGELLRRKGFWSAWNTKSTFNGSTPWVYTPFWFLCLVSALLVMITGPSAAIAVIPTLDWFPLSKPFLNDPSPYYIFNASTALWPETVTQDSMNGKDSGNECLSGLSLKASDCPAGGFRVLYDWTDNMIFDNLAVGSNISTPNDRGDTRRITNVRTCAGPSHTPAIATGRATAMSITSAISNALVGYWNFARNNWNGTGVEVAQPKILPDPTQQLYSPRVDVLCASYQYTENDIQNQKEMVFPTFDPSAPPSHVPESVLSNTRLLNETDFIFLPRTYSETGISLNGLATIPTVLFVNDTKYVQGTSMLPCSIYASWAPVSVSFEPNTQDQVSLQPLDDDNRCLNAETFGSPSSDSVHTTQRARNMTIDPRFARSINQNISFTAGNRSAIAGMLDGFLYESTNLPGSVNFRAPFRGSGNLTEIGREASNRQRADVIAAILAAVVTDGLSRIAAAGHYPYSAPFFMQHTAGTNNITGLNPISTASGGQTVPLNITEAELGNYIRLSPTLQRFGYGYKWHGNTTTQFGICVLLVHLILAVGHTCLVTYKTLVKHEGIGNSFDTIGEIVALALNSDKSERIQNTCGGITEAETWREVVAVREVYEGHLEMVVGQEEAVERGGRARVGVHYGHLKEKQKEKLD